MHIEGHQSTKARILAVFEVRDLEDCSDLDQQTPLFERSLSVETCILGGINPLKQDFCKKMERKAMHLEGC